MRAAVGFLANIGVMLAWAASAHAQVIEVDAQGAVKTYNGPTLFTEGKAVAIERQGRGAPIRSAFRPLLSTAHVEQDVGLLPGLLDAVAYRESRGHMEAVSPKGAIGIMQLMPGTAAELGVDPRDVEQNIRGGALYLKRQIDRFGSVALGLAAYNAGPGAVSKFGGIPPYRETRAYVSAILDRWQGRSVAGGGRERSVHSVPFLIEVTAP